MSRDQDEVSLRAGKSPLHKINKSRVVAMIGGKSNKNEQAVNFATQDEIEPIDNEFD